MSEAVVNAGDRSPSWAARGGLRFAVPVLLPLFLLFSVALAVVAFAYPLEIETRESTLWLHVTALKAGVNIFDYRQVAFINDHHGPFDCLFKTAVATLLPFLEPWHVTRFAVLVLPAMFLATGWVMLRGSGAAWTSKLYFGALGYLFLVVTAKEFFFVGRSDATLTLFFVPLVAVVVANPASAAARTLILGALSGLLGMAVFLSNWRTAPAVCAVVAFGGWRRLRADPGGRSRAAGYLGAAVGTAAAVLGLVIVGLFDGDVTRYYKHFFGFYTAASGWGHDPYEGSVLDFALGLFDPTASVTALKGGPLLLALGTYALIGRTEGKHRVSWAWLGGLVFATCTAAYFLNYQGGGAWYYITFLVVLWGHLGSVFARLPAWKLGLLGIGVSILITINVPTVIRPTLHRVATMDRAAAFLRELRALDRSSSVVSEDTFFFRSAYAGERIDMGDVISIVRRTRYFGPDFQRHVEEHFSRLENDPPEYVVTGFTQSRELRRILKRRYAVVASAPDNYTANGRGRTRVFRLATRHDPAR